MNEFRRGVMLMTDSTNVGHVVGHHDTACGQWDFDPEWMAYDYDFDAPFGQRLVHDYSVRVVRSCDSAMHGSIDRVCRECDLNVPDDLYPDLFHTYHFAYVDDMEIGYYRGNSMSESEWSIYVE